MAGADTDAHQYLRAWRKYRGKTLEQISPLVGSKVNTISGWENGKRRVNLDDLSRLASIYEVTAADLLRSPEAYDRQQSYSGLAGIADQLTPDQAAHLLWLAEEMTAVERQPKGPEPPRPFVVGGHVKRDQADPACAKNVVALARTPA